MPENFLQKKRGIRERRDKMNLERLLKPKAVAIVGANERMGTFGNYCAVNALQNTGHAQVYFVNQKSSMVLGKKTYASLADLPEVPDCVMLAIPRDAIPPVLEQAGALGVGAAIVVAAGYSEEGSAEGRAAEEALQRIAKKYDMAVMGPNCTGFLNNIDKIKLWGMGGTEFDMATRKTGIAFFAQSGTMGIHAISCPYVDTSYVFSMGNSSMVMVEDILEYVLEQPEVRLIAMYLEGVRDGKRFLQCLKRAAELEKPVVIHAAGMSEKGAVAAASHTGNLASSRAVYQAICKKYGVILVESIDEFLTAANVLSCWAGKMPAGGGVAAINGSGGENAVCADLCELYHVPLPKLSESTIERLREILPQFANPRNPLDMTAITEDTDGVVYNTLKAVGADPNVHAIIYSIASFAEPNAKDLAQAEMFGETINERYARPAIRYQQEPDSVPVMVIPMVEDRRDAQWRSRLRDSGIPIFGNSLVGYKVLGKLCEKSEYRYEERTLENTTPEHKHGKETVAYSEYASKQELGELGLPLPRQMMVNAPEQLSAALEYVGFPVAMKISSAQITHKTEAGGVVLNINSLSEATAAYQKIMESCQTYNPSAVLDGILVQHMAPKGVEMIVGISNDVHFGPMLMIGMGGVFVEVFQDTALYPCPLNKNEALEMIQSLKAYKLLKGYRGSAPCDISALADTMVKLSEYVATNKDRIKEIDLNPVFVYPEGQGIAIVDALLIKYADAL